MQIILPELLAHELKIEIEKNKPTFRHFKKDKLFYIIHIVYRGYLINFTDNKTDIDKHLSSKILQSLLGHEYDSYIKYLLENKFLLRIKPFKVGVNSYGYSLPYLEHYNPILYTLTDFVFKRRLRTCYSENKKRFPKDHQYLIQDFKHLKFNIQKARLFTDRVFRIRSSSNLYKDLVFESEKRKIRIRFKDHLCQKAFELDVIKSFENKDYGFALGKNNKRFNSIITRCPSVMRNFITCNNQNLVSIDLKSSQPYLLLILFNPQANEKIKNIFYSIYKSYITNITYPVTLDTFTQLTDLQEVMKYKDLLSNGLFYEHLFAKLGFDKNDYSFLKKQFKKCVFGAFYSNNQSNFKFINPRESSSLSNIGTNEMLLKKGRVGIKTILSLEFPFIFNVIKQLKSARHQDLSIFLQRVESYLFLEVIIPLIRKQNKAIPLFPVHDSLITTPAHQEFVLNTMRDVLEEYVGVTPSFSIEQLNIDKAEEYLGSLIERGRPLPKLISLDDQKETYAKAA